MNPFQRVEQVGQEILQFVSAPAPQQEQIFHGLMNQIEGTILGHPQSAYPQTYSYPQAPFQNPNTAFTQPYGAPSEPQKHHHHSSESQVPVYVDSFPGNNFQTAYSQPNYVQPTSNDQPFTNAQTHPMYGQNVPKPTILAPITGNRKALLVGIDYLHSPHRLNGCLYDVQNMGQLLSQYGFQNVITLRDDSTDPNYMPTRQNMMNAFQWLLSGAQPGDSLFFHYSGHGAQIPDPNAQKPSGCDEALIPVDYQTAGMILDDDIYENLVRLVPIGCRLTGVLDCCHSGTDFDLPYVFEATKRNFDISEMVMVHRTVMDQIRGRIRFRKTRDWELEGGKPASGDIVLFSACKDDQTAADTTSGQGSGGAMTTGFLSALQANPSQTYVQLLLSMRDILDVQQKLTQVPQLSASKPIDLHQMFSI